MDLTETGTPGIRTRAFLKEGIMREVDCDRCEGTGVEEVGCRDCRGSGEGPADGTTCYSCKGIGVFKRECEQCRGQGWYELEEDDE